MYTHTRRNQPTGLLRTAPRSFRIMFTLVATFIALTAVAVIVITIFSNGGGYSYKVNYQFGNTTYNEEYSINR